MELYKSYTNLHNIMSLLIPIPPERWKNIIFAVKQGHSRLKKNKKSDNKLTVFLNACVLQSDSLAPDSVGVASTSFQATTEPSPLSARGDDTSIQQQPQGCTVSDRDDATDKLSKTVEHMKGQLAEKCKEMSVCESKLSTVESQLAKSNEKVDELESDLVKLTIKLTQAKDEAKLCKGTVEYKQLKRREKYLTEKERRINQKLSNFHSMSDLKSKKLAVQKQLSTYKKRCQVYSSDKLAVVKELRQMKLRCVDLEAEILSPTDSKLETRSGGLNGQSFTDDIEKCVMELVGELDVPTNKCARVIHSVSKWLFNKSLTSQDLPCTTTVKNMADRAHFLSKIQVGETILESDKWDLHGDGTARNNRKIVGQQVTLGCGTSLSAGFTHVATEDSQTLLDNAIAMMDELAEVVDPENKETVYKSLLTKMFALMSDRSSVNKSFNEKLSSYRSNIIDNDSSADVHFLYCNAHFLLGLSNMAEQVLKKFVNSLEEQLGSRIGRDAHSKFSRFNSSGESGAARYVRTGCDVLGPRGDEKNGCRVEWEAFCNSVGERSNVTSFRMNRFNNFFEGAGALHFHKEHVIDFLGNYKDARNLKLEGVYCDATSDHLQACVRALGIIFHKITGPFWRMLQSDVNYADLHVYIQKMHKCFQQWSVDSSELLTLSCKGIFDNFYVVNHVHESLCSSGQTHQTVTLNLLKEFMKGFVTVTERQLNDFLPNGKYGQEASSELRESMAHCKVTNLLSEYEFGDLDYSQFRRRHASLHFHSGIQMCRQNKTISKWLASKSEMEQSVLLRKARKHAGDFRKRHIAHEKNVLDQVKKKLSDNYRKKKEKEAKDVKTKQNIIASVTDQNGPCKNASDVDRLLATCLSESKKKECLKNEIRYLKSVLGIKDQRLVFGKKSSCELSSDLKSVLSDSDSGTSVSSSSDEPARDVDSDEIRCGVKRMHSECSDNDELSTSDMAKRQKLSHSFCYERQGVWVCVAYEVDYFVGTVIDVLSPGAALIQFLQKGAKGSFRWPTVDDVAEVDCTFVISSDFEVVTSNGRTWDVPELEYLGELYEQFKESNFFNVDIGDDDTELS